MLFDGDNNSLEIYSKSLMKLFQNKRTEAIKILSTINKNLSGASDKIPFELAYFQSKDAV